MSKQASGKSRCRISSLHATPRGSLLKLLRPLRQVAMQPDHQTVNGMTGSPMIEDVSDHGLHIFKLARVRCLFGERADPASREREPWACLWWKLFLGRSFVGGAVETTDEKMSDGTNLKAAKPTCGKTLRHTTIPTAVSLSRC